MGTVTRAPGPTALERVLVAANQIGIDAEITQRVLRASDQFQSTMGDHADDRRTFDLMVSSATGDGLETKELDLKRSAFRTNREIMGKYAGVDISTLLLTPGTRDDRVDMTSIRGLVDLYRLRPEASLEISRHRFDRDDGSIHERQAFDQASSELDIPIALLQDFCSTPLPPLRQVNSPDGFVRTLVESVTLGLKSAVTCILADRTLDADPRDDDTPSLPGGIGHIHEVATPANVLLHDVFVHKSLAWNVMPEMRVIARRRDAIRWPGDDQTVLLPIQEEVKLIGQGIPAAASTDWPNYPMLLEQVCSRIDCNPEDLLLYRCRATYPVLHSVFWMRFRYPGSTS